MQTPTVALSGDETTRLRSYLRWIAYSCVAIIVLVVVCLGLSAASVSNGSAVVALYTHSLAQLAKATAAVTAAASAHSEGTPTSYSCHLPLSYQAKSPLAAGAWILLGDGFAAGSGTSTSYPAVLKSLESQANGYDPVVLNAVGLNQAADLTEQVRLLKASSKYQNVANTLNPILLIVSFGRTWLNAQQQMLGGAASVIGLVDQLKAIQGGNNSLISAANAGQFRVLLIAEPDPAYGGVYVPAEYAQCIYEPALNAPTSNSRILHSQAVADSAAALRNFAIIHGYAYLEVDAALGSFSLAMKASLADLSAFRDCENYGDVGHKMLADVISACLHNRAYPLPTKE